MTSITQNIFNFASQSSSNLPNSQSRISRDILGSVFSFLNIFPTFPRCYLKQLTRKNNQHVRCRWRTSEIMKFHFSMQKIWNVIFDLDKFGMMTKRMNYVCWDTINRPSKTKCAITELPWSRFASHESNINMEWFAWEYEGNSILRFRARQRHKQKQFHRLLAFSWDSKA